MTLEVELTEDLQRCMAQSDLGCLIAGENATEKAILLELLGNQLCIMRVLAAMNGIDPNPKAGRHLLPDPDGPD